jgi:hypothetical protein
LIRILLVKAIGPNLPIPICAENKHFDYARVTTPIQHPSMIERYTIKAAPAIPPKEMLKKLESLNDPAEIRKLQHLRMKIEVVGEVEDFKKIADFLKDLQHSST